MKINNLLIFTHIFFGAIILILLIRVIFFGSCLIYLLISLSVYLSTWAMIERKKEEIGLKQKINRLEKNNGRHM